MPCVLECDTNIHNNSYNPKQHMKNRGQEDKPYYCQNTVWGKVNESYQAQTVFKYCQMTNYEK